MLIGGAAASTNNSCAKFFDESTHCCSKSIGAQRVFRASIHQNRQTRIGDHAERPVPMLGQIRNVLGHLGWAGSAIQTKTGNWKRSQCIHYCRHVGAKQHGAGGLHGDAGKNRNVFMRLSNGADGIQAGTDSALHLQQILTGLNDQAIRATINEAARLLAI